MEAAVLVDVGRLEVRDVPRPRISPYDALVRVAAVGICGTDTHIFAGHANYNTDERGLPIPLHLQPQILGHEIEDCRSPIADWFVPLVWSSEGTVRKANC